MRHFSDTAEIDLRLARRYPRDVTLRDGTPITLTPMVPSDWQMLEAFLKATPAEERLFFRRAASESDRVRRWCSELDYRNTLPILAWKGDRIAADVILQREAGLWTSHVGRLRLLVHPPYRRRGLGTLMIGEALELAREHALHKVTYECAAEQREQIAFLLELGFHQAACLPDFVRDRSGHLHDMVLLVANVA